MERFSRKQYIGGGEISAEKKELHGFTDTHWHEFYELEYFYGGDGEYEIDGISYSIKRGMCFFMTPMNFHRVEAKKCRVYNVMFSEGACERRFLVPLCDGMRGSVFEIDEKEGALLEALLDELSGSGGEDGYSFYLLSVILGKLCAHGKKAIGDVSPIALSMQYILMNFRSSPSLEETAAYAGYTPTYFSSLFKKETGESYKQYLDRLRFEHARKLLISTDMSPSEVCKDSGFSDYPNFSRRYKKRFGVSPSEIKSVREQRKDIL